MGPTSLINDILLKWVRSKDHPAKLRLIGYTWRLAGSPPIVVPYVNGTLLRVDPTDYIGKRVIKQGTYEPEIYDLMANNLHPNAVFVDIGCHIGCFSIPLAKLCNRVFAIDPNPSVLEIAKGTSAINGLKNIEFHEAAISDRDGYADFFVTLESNSGISSLSMQWAKSYKKTRVRVLSLSAWLAAVGLDSIDLLKVDAEGESTNIILGAERVLPRIKSVVMEDSPQIERAVDILVRNCFSVSQPLQDAVEVETRGTIFAQNTRYV